MTACVFCDLIERGNYVFANDFAVGFHDSFPLSEGHSLVVPRIHAPDLFDLSREARMALWALVEEVHQQLTEELKPDGFNIGVNIGEVAGQTVHHAHVHVIPRRAGDIPDPRGGVRWVIPEKAPYWNEP